ncbi:MAG: hypothetical protein K2K46_01430 [Lachnospiraceae bacterium]|nr:hypothetical protein [Lachnospiraceae bacterium]
MKKTGIIVGGIVVVALLAAISPSKSDTPVESIELSIPNYQEEYDINTEFPIEVSILPEDADISTIEYIHDGDTLEFSDSGIMTGPEEGTYEIYVTSGDVTSNAITINVVDIAAREELLAKAEEERLAEEQAAKEAEAQKLAEEQAAKEAEAQAAKDAEAQRLAEEKAAKEAEAQAAKDAEAQKLAEEQAAKDAEAQKNSETQAAQESNSQSNTVPSGNGNNFNTYDNASQQQTEATYVLNNNTKKIHHPSCPSVKKIAPKNYATSNSSVDELIGQGYSTCGNCF